MSNTISHCNKCGFMTASLNVKICPYCDTRMTIENDEWNDDNIYQVEEDELENIEVDYDS